MKLSKNFVKDYVDIDVDINSLAEDMTKVGNEYEEVKKLLPATNLTIGKVLECENHPDSDHLHVCKVDIGSEILNIVCGAPNVRKGLKVIVALPGDFAETVPLDETVATFLLEVDQLTFLLVPITFSVLVFPV